MRVIRIGTKRYAAGLWWQMLKQPGARRSVKLQEARETASSFDDGFNVVVMRRNQYGLGRMDEKVVRVPSLAASLVKRAAQSLPRSWIGQFQMADGLWWVCAISDGSIAADGDVLCASAEDAAARVADLKSLTSWDSDVSFENVAESHAYLLPLLAGGERISPLQGGSSHNAKIIALGLAAILFSVGYGYHYQTTKAEESAKFRAARERILKQRTLADPEQQFPRPWIGKPSAAVFAASCFETVAGLPMFDRGWALSKVVCTPKGVEIEREHEAGASFTNMPAGAALDGHDASVCVARATLPALPDGHLSLSSVSETRARFYELVTVISSKGSVRFSQPKSKTVKVDGKPVVVRANWFGGTWKLSDVSPSVLLRPAFLKALGTVPGMEITQLTYTPKGITLEGSIYANQ